MDMQQNKQPISAAQETGPQSGGNPTDIVSFPEEILEAYRNAMESFAHLDEGIDQRVAELLKDSLHNLVMAARAGSRQVKDWNSNRIINTLNEVANRRGVSHNSQSATGVVLPGSFIALYLATDEAYSTYAETIGRSTDRLVFRFKNVFDYIVNAADVEFPHDHRSAQYSQAMSQLLDIATDSFDRVIISLRRRACHRHNVKRMFMKGIPPASYLNSELVKVANHLSNGRLLKIKNRDRKWEDCLLEFQSASQLASALEQRFLSATWKWWIKAISAVSMLALAAALSYLFVLVL